MKYFTIGLTILTAFVGLKCFQKFYFSKKKHITKQKTIERKSPTMLLTYNYLNNRYIPLNNRYISLNEYLLDKQLICLYFLTKKKITIKKKNLPIVIYQPKHLIKYKSLKYLDWCVL